MEEALCVCVDSFAITTEAFSLKIDRKFPALSLGTANFPTFLGYYLQLKRVLLN